MTNFCTLFDHNYLSRGLTLYESLKVNSSDSFCLYILAMDDAACDWLNANPHESIVVQNLADIKSAYPVLERLQQERSRAEFSWTLSSFSIQFFLKKYNLDSVTYIDSDICFYADPKILFDELNGESVIITPHNYTPKYDQSATSGMYCVQFMYFRNDEGGNRVLEWWRNECEKCCVGSPTDGKFGDQKYLDDWLSRFEGIVHEEKHIGCGVAPWNMQRFDLLKEDGAFFVQNKITKQKYRLVFFHYHGLKEFKDGQGGFVWKSNVGYEYPAQFVEALYMPYVENLERLAPQFPAKEYPLAQTPKPPSVAWLLYRALIKSAKMFLLSFMVWKNYKQIANEERQKLENDGTLFAGAKDTASL